MAGGPARVTQIDLEIPVSGAPKARATQVVVETPVRGFTPTARATQLSIQAQLALAPVKARATQISIDLLIPSWTIPMPLIYPDRNHLPGLTFSVIKRPIWSTGVDTAASGREVRVGYYSNPLWEFELTYNFLRDHEGFVELKKLEGLFLAVSGQLVGMLFKDPDDNSVVGQALLNPITGGTTTDGVATNFLAQRTWGVAEMGFTGTEPVGQIDTAQPVNVYLNGFYQDPSTYQVLTSPPVYNVIKFLNTPAAGQTITADFSYYYYVRFKDDSKDFEKFLNQLWRLKKVTLRSLRSE